MQMRGFIAIAVVVLSLTSLTGATTDQQTPPASASRYATVSGRVELVSDGNRAPLRRATVTLTSESGTLTRKVATEANGQYWFDGLAPGNYRVTVEKAGFLATEGPFVTPVAGSQHVVNFTAERAGALEGRLIEDTGRPIANLAVTAEQIAGDRSQAATPRTYAAKTDDLGRFRIHTLPAGRYRISATPPSPAAGARLYYPGTEKTEDAGILVVATGQSTDNLSFVVATGSLPAVAAEAMANQELDAMSAPSRGGTWGQITGRVTRSDVGQPVPNAAVKLSLGGVLVRTTWTDGAGEYSFRRVMAGAYQLGVSADGYASTALSPARISVADGERAKRDLSLVPLSAIEGRVVDEFGDPAPGVFLRIAPQTADPNSVLARPPAISSALTDDRGSFRVSGLLPGDYYVVALPEPFARSGPAAFPITSVAVQFTAGSDLHAVNLVLPAVSTFPISGAVVDARGQRVPRSLVTLSPPVDAPSMAALRAPITADANGNFVFPSVPTGTYIVEARRADTFEVGQVTITTPAEPFSLALKALSAARGRVIFEEGAPPQVSANMADILRRSTLRFLPAALRTEEAIVLGRPGVIETDWSFQISGLAAPGLIRTNDFFLESLGFGLARVVLNGRDITDVPYDFQSGDVDGIEVVLTRRLCRITGVVSGVVEPITVIAFGADGDSWPYLSRTLRSVALKDSSGAFTLQGLLPGRYLVVAVRSGTPQSTPEALAALRSLATPVIVTDGADAPIRLSIVR